MIRYIVLCLLLILLVPVSTPAVEQINLMQAERLALERNLNLKAANFDTRASAALVRRGYGIYDPQLTASWSEGETEDLSNTSTLPEVAVETRTFDFSLGQLLPTGAELVAAFANDRSRTETRPTPFVNPSYRTEASLSLTQPLLQGFGRTVTERQILYAIQDRRAGGC
ncbi:MAG: TolC family protein [Desulfuromonadaceae bacterium]